MKREFWCDERGGLVRRLREKARKLDTSNFSITQLFFDN